ncbi:endospore germination permease [Clostridium intestinale]|uniref:GerAB/ArcD/ProY family transporter n=1 Tax=Clostridium intestinale TaxID=36845 RepID=UPI0028E3CA09|nr:endospore germination permease [Clostridium intestinale]
MQKQGTLTFYESFAFITLITMSKIFYTSVTSAMNLTKTSTWFMTLISCFSSVIMFYICCKLMERFPGENLFGVFEGILGKFFGKIFGMFVCAYAVYYSSSNLLEFVNMLKVYSLPNTPPTLIITTMLIAALIIVYLGLEVIGKISSLLLIPVILGLLSIFLFAAPKYNFDAIKPYLGVGLKKTFEVGFLRSSAYTEVTILLVLINSIGGVKQIKKIGISSLILTGILFSISFLCYTFIFGYAAGGENISGLFELSTTIYFNRFFQRVDSILLFTWIIPSIVTTSAGIYLCLIDYSNVFKIKDYKPLIFPFLFIIFVVTSLPKNSSEVIEINMKIIRQYSFLPLYIFPIILLIISILFNKKGKNYNAKKA